MWAISSTGSVSMLPYRMVVPGGAGRMLSAHGVPSKRRRGTVVIMAPESITALGSSGLMWTSWVWVRASN